MDAQTAFFLDFAQGGRCRVFAAFNMPAQPVVLVREDTSMRRAFHQQNGVAVGDKHQRPRDAEPASLRGVRALPFRAHCLPLFCRAALSVLGYI